MSEVLQNIYRQVALGDLTGALIAYLGLQYQNRLPTEQEREDAKRDIDAMAQKLKSKSNPKTRRLPRDKALELSYTVSV